MLAYFISLALFVGYIATVMIKFGVPKSLSETYYLFKFGKVWFWIWSVSVVIPLLIFWFEKTSGTNFQFLVFFGCAALIFVTTAGDFKDKTHERAHYIFAACCALFSQMALLIYAPWLMIPVALFVFVGCFILGFLSGIYRDGAGLAKWKNSHIFWLEMACFINVYIGLTLI